jgi:hypothetical protein
MKQFISKLNIKKLLKARYLAFLAILALVLVIISIFLLKKNMEKITFENHAFYQYLSHNRFEYEGILSLNHNGNITELNFKDVKVTLDSTPLYFLDESKVILPKTMLIAYPISGGLQYKINYFSTIYTEGNTIYLTDGKLKKNLSNAFIYDGEDTYFFIDDTKINVNGTEYLLSPLSYVVTRYNSVIEIYNKAKDEYKVINIGDQEIIAAANGYKINLSIDAIDYNNKSRLLIKNMKFLNNLK